MKIAEEGNVDNKINWILYLLDVNLTYLLIKSTFKNIIKLN